MFIDKNKASTTIRVRIRRGIVTIPVPQSTVQVVTIVTTEPHKKRRVKLTRYTSNPFIYFIIYKKNIIFNSSAFQLTFMGVDHPQTPVILVR